ncbi:MAG: hypothetical protein DME18_00950, partial [Verrucomicrobia bacterium]
WRIRYQDRETPQPVATWNASPTDLKIAFDRTLDVEGLKDLSKKARVESGKYVAAGDRFETLRPGYQVVYDQLATPRYTHEILSASVSPDHRTLTLVTRPRNPAVNYAVTLPSVAADARRRTSGMSNPTRDLGTYDEIDLLTDLTGVEAQWESVDEKKSWFGWLPHLDLQVARELTRGSAEHERLLSLLNQSGQLRLRGQLDLWQMLLPAVQPGSMIDWLRPPEDVTVVIEASAPFSLKLADKSLTSAKTDRGAQRAETQLRAPGQRWQPIELKLATGGEVALTATWFTADDPRPRPFPLRRWLLPWAQPSDAAPAAPMERQIPGIAGGHWLPGKRLFFSDRLGCAKCHVIRGEGQRVGPDLSNLVHRDYASVRKDIEFPNAALNPDHLASVIELSDGESLTGLVQREADGAFQVATANGVVQQIGREKVKSVKPSAVSLMPEGLWQGMTSEERRDLMTFLLTSPLEPEALPVEAQGQKPPPARKRPELEALLSVSYESRGTNHVPANSSQSRLGPAATSLRVVLCASPKDAGHGALGFHDYPLWRERWSKLLSLADGVTVETADRWPGPEQWQGADLVAFYHDNPAWTGEKAKDLDAFLERGGGLVFLHWSMNAYRDVDPLAARLGCAWGPGARFRYGMESLQFSSHELTAGLTATQLVDESYWKLTGDFAGATVLAASFEDGESQPQIWIREQGKGRVFVCIPGHFTWTFDDPLYRLLVLRGFCWAANQPMDRL